ncbi:MAG: efflux RND transporter permease subunit [Candidatus Omnitrophica bacterium]|nr:efflux RND transporter permease subunit [Candidatus Omnitrophota bacterium]
MNLAKFSVKNSLFINFLSLLLLVLGVVAAFVTRKEAFPNVRFDYAAVQTVYPGASSEDVEKYVTTPLEKEIRDISGVEEISSSSKENLSSISVKIDPDADKDKTVDNIQKAVDRVSDLPAEVADDPIVTDINAEEYPVIEYCMAGLPERELQMYAEALEDRLRDVPGVARVTRRGWRDTEVWVEVDSEKMREFYVSHEEIAAALKRKNVSMPSGKFYAQDKEIHVRTTGEFKSLEEIENVIIRANDAGNWLRIKDVAKVKYDFEDEDTINKTYGKRSINLIVMKRERDDAIKVVSESSIVIRDFLKEAPEGLVVTKANDVSYYIKRRLNVLKRNAAMGIVLVILSLLLFLSRRVALFTALGMIIAFSFSIFIMGSIDISINLISMFGLIVVLGMLVDDGIIIAENCYRYIEQGYDPREAAVIGTNEVARPVTAAVLTTMVAAAPLLFMSGMMGRFIRSIPIVVIIALAVSLFEAIIILPSHIADFVKPPKKAASGKPVSKKDTRWFQAILGFYTGVIKGAIKNRYFVILGVLILFILCLGIASRLGFEMFSSRGIEQFSVTIEAESGTPLYATEKLLRPVEELIGEIPEHELDNYVTQVGQSGEGGMTGGRGVARGGHLAMITVYLTPPEGRSREAGEIIEELREKSAHIKDIKVTYEKHRHGPPVGRAVEFKIRGEKYSTLLEIGQRYKDFLGTIDGVKDIGDDYESGKKEIMVEVDEGKAMRAGLSISAIGSSVRSAFKGTIATTIKQEKAEEEIDVIVRLRQEEKDSDGVFNKIMIPNKYDKLIPLKNVATFKESEGMYYINHIEGKKALVVFADVDNQKTNSNEVNRKILKHFENIENEYLGYTAEAGGEFEEQMKSMRSLLIAFLLAFFLIFMILAAMFNSIVLPLVIMVAIPFGMIGVIISLPLHGMSMSFFSVLGMIFLTGIVVNDSIVLVDFINKLRKSGIDRRHSIIQAGQLRLRPVILTTLTTVLGLVPVAYAIGGGDPILIPMALAICWGLLFATMLTLIVIPCIYAIMDDIAIRFLHRPTVVRNNKR